MGLVTTVSYFWLKHDSNAHFNAQQVELSNPDAELRLLEVFYHKIYKVRAFTLVVYVKHFPQRFLYTLF